MTDDRELESGLEPWICARRSADVPAGFADRVMESVLRERPAGPRGAGVPALLAAVGRIPLLRAAAVLLAAVLFLGRVASLFAVFATP